MADGAAINDPSSLRPDRLDILDALRGLGIVLVVYGHVARGLMKAGVLPDGGLWRSADALVYSFHMPLFFILAGWLFRQSLARQGALRLLGNKIRTVVYPYLLWSVVQGSVEILTAGSTNSGNRPDLLQILWQPFDQFWFLYALFYVFVVATLIYTISRRHLTPLLLLSVGLYLIPPQTMTGNALVYVAQYLLYFALGVLCSLKLPVPLPPTRRWVFGVLGAAITLAINFYPIEWDAESLNWVGRLTSLGCALGAAIACLCGVSSLWPSLQGWLRHYGRYSLQIFLLHILLASGARIVLLKLFGIHSAGLHLFVGLGAGVWGSVALAAALEVRGFGFLFAWPRLKADALKPIA